MPRGIIQTVRTRAGNVYTAQRLKSGQTVYRKNGKFTKARAFHGAKGSKAATLRSGNVARAPGLEDWIPPYTAWATDRTESAPHGTAGVFASDVIPSLREGDTLTQEQRRILSEAGRMARSFQGFWASPKNRNLSRTEAEQKFQAFLAAIEGVNAARASDEIREEFDLRRYKSFN